MQRLILAVFFSSALASAETVRGDESVLSRIAFGSCAKQDQPQPIWDAVVESKPQLFVLLGDNIYADTQDMEVMRAKYRMFGEQPGYRKLKQVCPVVGTWDDHDFGVDDGGAEYPLKRQSQQLFLDFLDVPQEDPRRKQEGVYHARVFGPAGKRVQVILLDTRYFRSPLKTGYQAGEPGEGRRGKYLPQDDRSTTVLGDAQWKWLEAQLKMPAELRIVASSVQVIANDHAWESWANFPHERERLLRLVRDTRANGVVFLSGDRHLAEISMLPAGEGGAGYPLYDVTSSSLNAPSGNKTKAGARFGNEINSHAVGRTYFDVNFGTIYIDWDQTDPVVRAQVRDEKGDVVLQQRVTVGALKPAP